MIEIFYNKNKSSWTKWASRIFIFHFSKIFFYFTHQNLSHLGHWISIIWTHFLFTTLFSNIMIADHIRNICKHQACMLWAFSFLETAWVYIGFWPRAFLVRKYIQIRISEYQIDIERDKRHLYVGWKLCFQKCLSKHRTEKPVKTHAVQYLKAKLQDKGNI